MVAPDLSKEVIAARIKGAYLAKKAEVEATGDTYGIRTAARNIVARTEDGLGINPATSIESWRKQIQRYLGATEVKPTKSTRLALAEEFGCDPAHFGVGEFPVISGGEMFAGLLDDIRESRRCTERLEQKVVLLMERMEAA